MGLAISRSIIEAHGGKLWASANAPRGAILQFALPSYPRGCAIKAGHPCAALVALAANLKQSKPKYNRFTLAFIPHFLKCCRVFAQAQWRRAQARG